MASPLIKDSFCSNLCRTLFGKGIIAHTEEHPDYQVPEKYWLKTDPSSDSIGSGPSCVLVTYDGPTDPDNPKNWPPTTKIAVSAQVAFLTLTCVMSSSLYSPSVAQLQADFHISHTQAELPLALYVIGFAVGPMVLAPMSENPSIGRAPIYILSHFAYIVLQIPQSWGAATRSFPALAVLRFLTGVLASPVLAVGSASCGDIMNVPYLPMAIVVWSASSIAGPCIGPVIGAALTNASKSWHWCFRFQMILGIGSFVVCLIFLPETYTPAILHRKAMRLRTLTGNHRIFTRHEIDHPPTTFAKNAKRTLWRPIILSISEPMVLLINTYTSLLYAIMFLWFSAFPIVFQKLYNFTLVELGAAYLGVLSGVLLGALLFMVVIYHIYTKRHLRETKSTITPEVFMPAAIYGSLWIPTGIFIFAWTSKASISWIVPIIGGFVFSHGTFIIFQTLFNYLATSFPRYVASTFASNALCRSLVAGVAPLFGTYMFDNLKTDNYPVGWGASILGFLTAAMISIPILFYINGPKLRGKSLFAGF